MDRKKAWLVYNGSLASAKFDQINKWYQASAKKKGIDLELIKNNEIYSLVHDGVSKLKTKAQIKEPDFILFLDKDIRLANHLEKLAYKLFNRARTIAICDDKILTHQILSDHKIPMPKSLISPMMFFGTQEDGHEFIDFVEQEFTYPIVVKEAFGSFGAQVYLVNNRDGLIKKRKELRYKPHLYQEFVETSKGRDVRLHIVGDKVVASMLRRSETDFRANVSSGGKMYPFDPPQAFIDLALKASSLVGADFSGVDILFGKDGQPMICEINSNAHIKNIHECTGVDVADHIFDYILREIEND